MVTTSPNFRQPAACQAERRNALLKKIIAVSDHLAWEGAADNGDEQRGNTRILERSKPPLPRRRLLSAGLGGLESLK
jgi:hypothetical protein